jgi:mannose-6-phosphate isomerase-like protein (cupin superfamily)
MGPIRAVFKADSNELAGSYSVSERWLEPRTRGPGVHAHPEDHVFYVVAGTLSLRLNDEWSPVTKGSCDHSRRNASRLQESMTGSLRFYIFQFAGRI